MEDGDEYLELASPEVVDRVARAVAKEQLGLGLRALALRDGVTIPQVIVEALADAGEAGLHWLDSLPPDERRRAYVTVHRAEVQGVVKTSREKASSKKGLYLEVLKDSCDLVVARQTAGISPALPYAWARKDPEFLREWNEARAFAGLEEFKL